MYVMLLNAYCVSFISVYDGDWGTFGVSVFFF